MHHNVYRCAYCQKEFYKDQTGHHVYKFCSLSCSGSYHRRLSNPMDKVEVRDKVKATLRRIGRRPIIRGGNGTGPTKSEQLLVQHLPGISWNFAVGLGKWQSGYPKNYKLDLAYPALKLGIEVDGLSHCLVARKAQDLKKVEKLTSLGWIVLRFSNAQVTQQTDEVLSTILKWKGIRVSQLGERSCITVNHFEHTSEN